MVLILTSINSIEKEHPIPNLAFVFVAIFSRHSNSKEFVVEFLYELNTKQNSNFLF